MDNVPILIKTKHDEDDDDKKEKNLTRIMYQKAFAHCFIMLKWFLSFFSVCLFHYFGKSYTYFSKWKKKRERRENKTKHRSLCEAGSLERKERIECVCVCVCVRLNGANYWRYLPMMHCLIAGFGHYFSFSSPSKGLRRMYLFFFFFWIKFFFV